MPLTTEIITDTDKPPPIEARMKGIEDLMRALDEGPMTVQRLFSLVHNYKLEIGMPTEPLDATETPSRVVRSGLI